jgi:hypothetical protein
MSDEIRVNGNTHSWGSITIKCGNQQFTGFTEITYADSRERAKGYGLGKHQAPTRRSRGKYGCENTKLKGFKSSIQQLREDLADSNGNYGDTEFLVVIQYIDTGDKSITVEIGRNVIVKNSSSESEGADLLQEEIELDTMWIKRNGKTLFDASQGWAA